MTEHYPAPDEDSEGIYGKAGADHSEAWHAAPPRRPAAARGSSRRKPRGTFHCCNPCQRRHAIRSCRTRTSRRRRLYAHKNEVLYAFGGLFFPGLVLLLMGQKKLGIIMLCCWLASIALSIVLIGIPLLVGTYIWSVIACYREARRQNEAHGFVS